MADAGVAMEPASGAYGLGFISLADEHFDLVIPAGQISTRVAESGSRRCQGGTKGISPVRTTGSRPRSR
ncbi:MAG: substrate-binding domain-containing protein [Streptosporangiaceae bacterium]